MLFIYPKGGVAAKLWRNKVIIYKFLTPKPTFCEKFSLDSK